MYKKSKKAVLMILVATLLAVSWGFIEDAHAKKNPCAAKNPCEMKNPCGAKNPCGIADTPLVCPINVKKEACPHNVEGISHVKEGHWDVAAKHFEEAVKADPNFAEAHYNLALALHNLGRHEEAIEHFKTAKKLAPKNVMIQKSEVLNQHLGKNPCSKHPCGKM